LTGTTSIAIDFNVSDRVRSIKRLVQLLTQVEEVSPGTSLEIDLRKCQYLGPDAAAILTAVVRDAQSNGILTRILSPLGPPELCAFFRVSGLANLAVVSESVSAEPDDVIRPVLAVTQIRRASFNDADPIIALVSKHGTLDPEAEEYLRICINEVVQNVQDHAKSSVGAMMTARFMAKANEVRVAIVDRGIGMCTTLRKRYPDTTPENVMQRVLQGSYSARSRENNMGLGLSNLAAIITRLEGGLFMLSENSMAEIRKGDERSFSMVSPGFRGTGVFFTLPVGA
jgi:hypothetical protein